MTPNTYEERFGVDLVGDENEFDPARWDGPEHKAGLPKRHPETGLDVLIVGGGMGGLMTALECWRKGHTVVGILERSKSPVYSGMALVRPDTPLHGWLTDDVMHQETSSPSCPQSHRSYDTGRTCRATCNTTRSMST